jgi:hypothetical protein
LTDAIVSYAIEALSILERDRPRMDRIQRYFDGDHDMPYMPDSAEAEYRMLAKRGITNWMPLLVNTPAQGLYVDNFRKGDSSPLSELSHNPEWSCWQRSLMSARQNSIYIDAFKFGHSFVVTERDKKGSVVHRGLSARRTVALYEDPVADLDPVAGVYVKKWAKGEDSPGTIIIWDERRKYTLRYLKGEDPVRTGKGEAHGLDECPVTRFHAYMDLEGNTWGLLEPFMAVQDRINQTIFDLLVAQTYNSFEVRTVTGLAPPMKMVYNEETGLSEPLLDADGNPQPDRVYLNASRFMYAADKEAKFGSLPGGRLDGFIASAELAIRHLSALTQTPPHFLLGQIANISAEALEAAEVSLSRKIDGFRTTFAESWERCFRLSSVLLDLEGGDDFSGEVVWRDLGASSLAQSADALGKFAESLGIPTEGLWHRVPGVSRAELVEWKRLADERDVDVQILQTAAGMRQGPMVQPSTPTRFAQEAMTDGNTAEASRGRAGV